MGSPLYLTSLPTGRRPGDADRRQRILEAAERAFVRHGFHATTMQHVADEAGMSAGNLYRYFPSKEAIVEGLCELDQAERAQAFAKLMADHRQIMQALRDGLRQHVLAKPPEKARLLVEIWAEAGRNPRVAAMIAAIDAEVLAGLEQLIDTAKAAQRLRPGSTPVSAPSSSSLSSPASSSESRSRTISTPDAETPMAIGVLKALLAGALSPDLAPPLAQAP